MERTSQLFKIFGLASLLVFGFAANSFAEGTAQTTESNSDYTHLLTNYGEYNDFGRYNGTVDQRLFIHIEDPETITVSSSGNYSVTVTDANGCESESGFLDRNGVGPSRTDNYCGWTA